jgi:hypothetical protein
LKKRTKKLLLLIRCPSLKDESATATNKSFLVLFFKKELLPCFASGEHPCDRPAGVTPSKTAKRTVPRKNLTAREE